MLLAKKSCSSLASVAVMHTMAKSNLEEERDCLAYTLRAQSIMKYAQVTSLLLYSPGPKSRKWYHPH